MVDESMTQSIWPCQGRGQDFYGRLKARLSGTGQELGEGNLQHEEGRSGPILSNMPSKPAGWARANIGAHRSLFA
jgi:hypothetical protein